MKPNWISFQKTFHFLFCFILRLNQNLFNFRITFFGGFVCPLDMSVSLDSTDSIQKKKFGFGRRRRLSSQWNVSLNYVNVFLRLQIVVDSLFVVLIWKKPTDLRNQKNYWSKKIILASSRPKPVTELRQNTYPEIRFLLLLF